MKLTLFILIVAAVLTTQPAVAAPLARITAALPDIEPPPQGDAWWVVQSMRLNGLPMTLKAFRSRLAPDAVLHHYESWSRGLGDSQTRRSMNPPWSILAIQSRAHYITIQARAMLGGSEGTIAVSPPLAQARRAAGTQFPHPETTIVVNLQQYEDAGIEAEHISLTSARSASTEALAFSQLLARDGWRIARDERGKQDVRSHIVEAQKGAGHALVTLMPDHTRSAATAIVVVWRKE